MIPGSALRIVAQGFGSGLVPRAPGTAGTLLAVLIYLPLSMLGAWLYPLFVALAFAAGVYLCGRVASEMGQHDHPSIVWDEMVGFWAVMIAAPDGWYWIPVAFLLFRAFDILKPWPISWLDRHVDGGLGIMADDLAAALVSWVLLHLSELGLRWLGVIA